MMRLRTVLSFYFVVIFLVTMIILTAFGYRSIREDSDEETLAKLDTIADLKVAQIELLTDQIKAHLMIAQDYYNIKKNLPILSKEIKDRNSPEYSASKKMLDEQVRAIPMMVSQVKNMLLIDADGVVVYCTNEECEQKFVGKPLPEMYKDAFEEGKKGVYYTKILREEGYDEPAVMLVLGPSYGFNGEFIGVIGFVFNLDFINTVSVDVTGLGSTGETVIAENTPNYALIVNSLRHAPDSALNMKIYFNESLGVPIQNAAMGLRGSGESIDYRAHPVLAAWRHIPSLDWALVVKIDVEEAGYRVFSLGQRLIMIMAVAGILMFLLVIAMSGAVTRPLRKMEEAVDQIVQGKFDIELNKSRIDEVQSLIHSFNRILASLKLAVLRSKMNNEEESGLEKTKPAAKATTTKRNIKKMKTS